MGYPYPARHDRDSQSSTVANADDDDAVWNLDGLRPGRRFLALLKAGERPRAHWRVSPVCGPGMMITSGIGATVYCKQSAPR